MSESIKNKIKNMATEDNDKLKALKLTIDKLDKTFGKDQ